jgi:hypothetical protein
MSKPRESVNLDVMGRVMSLEQRTKGLQGRIAALEARLSGPAGQDIAVDPGNRDDLEFIQALPLSGLRPGLEAHDTWQPVPEPMMDPHENSASPRPGALRPVDTTGIIAGAILIGAGLLLYTGNIDLIKNPLLSFGCGIFVTILSLLKSPGKNIWKKNVE